MFKVVSRIDTLDGMRCERGAVSIALNDRRIYSRVRAEIQCLNDAYGEDRDIEADLGGYVAVIWGNSSQIQEDFERIIRHHNLVEDEYEYMDKVVLPERSDITVTFRLFLCSSDYAVEIVTMEEKDQ